MIRVMIPSSMLFMTNFAVYIKFILPLAVIVQCYMTSQAYNVYGHEQAQCERLLESFDTAQVIVKDLGFLIFFSIGIYSQNKSLVVRFILHENVMT